MAHFLERLTRPVKVARPKAMVVVGVSVLSAALVATVWFTAHRPSDVPGRERSAVATVRPFSASIAVVGDVIPGESIGITAPFDGTIKAVRFEYGDAVKAGQLLLTMDTFDVLQHRDEAQASFWKASQAAAEMANWSNGPEVSRARRAVTAAELDLNSTQHKSQETQSLLTRGLVARMDYDVLVQQQRIQEMALTAAREDLQVVRKRGEGLSRAESAITLRSAQARLVDVTKQLSGAAVMAPESGIIVRPPSGKPADSGSIHSGERVTRGQLLGSITKFGTLAVSFKLSEADALKVHAGQRVAVTGPGFGDRPLPGRIVNVAGEATPGENGGGGAVFAAKAVLDPGPAIANPAVRIGMTANVSISTYANPTALVVPLEAIMGSPPAFSVAVRDRLTGKESLRSITVGEISPAEAEILSGLRPGEVVVWSAAGPSAGSTAHP